ncbi:DUF5304 domain-containing protein [Streptomyces sp. NPDC046866]|uniref:DUF5304 domain-containing protein n=1 Tax=Streptomyces sp. NPDC046866 TaxID=3154921 RepID=UPI0034520C64
MSEATDRPADDDAWATACAEDLAAEKERRRTRHGGGADTGTAGAAEELYKLFEAVADKVSALNNPLLAATAQGALRQFVDQAKAAAKPVVERNPEVFGHLAAAGSELLAAYRSAVEGHERRWTRDEPAPGPGAGRPSDRPSGDGSDPRDEGGAGPGHRIDLD